MRAIVVERHGPPEVLQLREVPEPDVEANQVLIRVQYIGVNSADLLARMGVYPGTPKPPFVPGLEVAGAVEKLPPPPVGRGRRLTKDGEALQIGERVVALTLSGGYAEQVCVPERQVFRVPDQIPLEDAAAIPMNYLAAYHAMFRMGNLQEGDRILIHSAAGGVGISAVQLAKARKLVVFGTAGTAKQEFLREIGVDCPIDCTRQNFVAVVRGAAPDGIEMVMDPIGGKSLSKSLRCLGLTGRLVFHGFASAAGPAGKPGLWSRVKTVLETPRFNPLKLANRNLAVIGIHLGGLEGHSNILRKELGEIFQMYTAGQIKPVIGKTFPLEEAVGAHRFHGRQNPGKVLLIAG